MKHAITMISCLALSLGCSSQPTESANPQSKAAPIGWTHHHTTIVEDGHPAEIDYWIRGDEVVRQYRDNGAIAYDERCEGKRLFIRELAPPNDEAKPGFSYKESSDRDSARSCFDAATHEELRYLRGSSDLGMPEHITLSDGRGGLRWIGGSGHQFVVDEKTKLPVRVDYGSEESGGITNIAFNAFESEVVAQPPAAPEVEWSGFQATSDVPVAEAGTALGLSSVPNTVAGLRLGHAWSFLTQNLSQPTYYLIWGDDARNVQLISTRATLPEALRGYSPEGTEYDTQEGDRHVKVGTIGGDAAVLRAALSVLRPSALEDSKHRSEDPRLLAE
jgi:hypothetical protein